MNKINQIYLKQIFKYENGGLFWRERSSSYSRVNIGSRAGCVGINGYIKIKILGSHYLEHRLVYIYHHGLEPEQIDHINGDKSDNRIENLRLCNAAQNSWNKGVSIRNKSGFSGVMFDDNAKKWRVRIMKNGLRKSYGSFELLDDAVKVAKYKKEELYGEFNHAPPQWRE